MSTASDLPVPASCPYAADAVACVLNADNCPETVGTAHLASCPVCQQEAAAACETISRLRAVPELLPSPDLTQRILAALPPPEYRSRFLRLRPLAVAAAAAAAVVVLAGGVLWFCADHTGSRVALVSERWLLRTQRADGLWQPAGMMGGSRAYAPALTALAALALEQRGVANRLAVDHAIAALLAGQQPDGTFGPRGRCRAYNHSMTTASLLAIRQLRPQALPEAPLQRAVALIRATQNAGGAWGYETDDPPNTALTVWQTDALLRAQASGWGDPDGHLRKAIRWLRAQQATSGHFAYNSTLGTPTATLDAMGVAILLEAQLTADDRQALVHQTAQALQTVADEPGADFYRDYFAARALDAMGDSTRAANIRERVTALQAASGSWDTADRWTPIGGQLYATVIALLTVE